MKKDVDSRHLWAKGKGNGWEYKLISTLGRGIKKGFSPRKGGGGAVRRVSVTLSRIPFSTFFSGLFPSFARELHGPGHSPGITPAE